VIRRDRDWKLVYHLGDPEGALHDLRADPYEVENLRGAPAHRELRERWIRELHDWSLRGALRTRMPGRRAPQQRMFI
jgi:arylsulfatase A-like enzyme